MAKILVVEDDPALRKIYVAILTKEGHEVRGAHDGEDGLRQATAEEPDLILLDMIMPKMTGIDFLRAFQQRTRHPQVKIIGFSNTDTPDFLDEALKLGAAKYTPKYSFTPKALAGLIRDTLSQP